MNVNICCTSCYRTNRIPADRLSEKPVCGACNEKIFTGTPPEVNELGLSKILRNSDIPVLVDFWAPWCGPCRQMAPAFATACVQLEPDYRLCKIDIEQHQVSASTHNVRSIPLLVLFQNGKEVNRSSGAMDTASIVRFVKDNVMK